MKRGVKTKVEKMFPLLITPRTLSSISLAREAFLVYILSQIEGRSTSLLLPRLTKV